MERNSIATGLATLMFALSAGTSHRAYAFGEAINGYPNWSERVLLEWLNRARSDPQADLAGCSSSTCAEKACYTSAVPPRYLIDDLEHSSRFHSTAMMLNTFFSHPTQCTLKTNIDSLYPATCDGSASCMCTQGALTTNQSLWTDPFTRIGYFGQANVAASEIIAAGYSGPNDTFYNGWLYEPSSNAACGEHDNQDNGHRFIILYNGFGENAGAGYVPRSGSAPYQSYATMDFAGTAPAHPKIPSGSHYPQQAATVDAWANWYDTAAPILHQINVDGVCSNMALTRGSATNGAYHATISGVGTGCHRYLFTFTDSGGHVVHYPTTGSLAIGNGSAQCPDWSSTAPTSCDDSIFTDDFE